MASTTIASANEASNSTTLIVVILAAGLLVLIVIIAGVVIVTCWRIWRTKTSTPPKGNTIEEMTDVLTTINQAYSAADIISGNPHSGDYEIVDREEYSSVTNIVQDNGGPLTANLDSFNQDDYEIVDMPREINQQTVKMESLSENGNYDSDMYEDVEWGKVREEYVSMESDKPTYIHETTAEMTSTMKNRVANGVTKSSCDQITATSESYKVSVHENTEDTKGVYGNVGYSPIASLMLYENINIKQS